MGSKNITVTQEAYERLKAHKRPDESFTDVVLRLAENEGDRWAGYGAMRNVDGFHEAVERGGEKLEADYAERQRRLFGEEETAE